MKILLGILLILSFRVSSQENQVFNGNFDINQNCNLTQTVENKVGWFNPNNGTSDALDSCYFDLLSNRDVPFNAYGYQNPVSGSGYAGFTHTLLQIIIKENMSLVR